MKLLGGLTQQQNAAQSEQNATPFSGNAPNLAAELNNPPRTAAPEQEGVRNVMADVIARHERISSRVRKGK